MSKLMNYDENAIRENFRLSKEEHVVAFISSPKIEPQNTTLKALCEGSAKLLKEDTNFLKETYGSD